MTSPEPIYQIDHVGNTFDITTQGLARSTRQSSEFKAMVEAGPFHNSDFSGQNASLFRYRKREPLIDQRRLPSEGRAFLSHPELHLFDSPNNIRPGDRMIVIHDSKAGKKLFNRCLKQGTSIPVVVGKAARGKASDWVPMGRYKVHPPRAPQPGEFLRLASATQNRVLDMYVALVLYDRKLYGKKKSRRAETILTRLLSLAESRKGDALEGSELRAHLRRELEEGGGAGTIACFWPLESTGECHPADEWETMVKRREARLSPQLS